MNVITAAIPVLIGLLVLIGWQWDIEVLKRISVHLVPMNPVTALDMVLGGAALLLYPLHQRAPRLRTIILLCGICIGVVALLKLSQLALGSPIAVDAWLFAAKLGLGPGTANRMAPNTALNFLILSVVIVLLTDGRGIVVTQILAVVIASFALLAIVGYTYGISRFYGVGLFTPMAVHTATSFLLLSGAVLYARPDAGLMTIVTNRGPAGRTARLLLPCAILIPIVLGWFRLAGQKAGLYESEFGIAIFVVTNVLFFVALIWWNARQLFETDQQRITAENLLRHTSTHDGLTGLANRSLFMDRFSHRLKIQKRRPTALFAVFYMDLDGFKQVNDRMGHAAGDKLLQQVAQKLKQCGRDTDLVARLGGDEFAVLAEELAHAADAPVLAQRIVESIQGSFSSGNQTAWVGISIGIAVYESAYASHDDMVAHADAALYQAKQGGKGRYVVYSRTELDTTAATAVTSATAAQGPA